MSKITHSAHKFGYFVPKILPPNLDLMENNFRVRRRLTGTAFSIWWHRAVPDLATQDSPSGGDESTGQRGHKWPVPQFLEPKPENWLFGTFFIWNCKYLVEFFWDFLNFKIFELKDFLKCLFLRRDINVCQKMMKTDYKLSLYTFIWNFSDKVYPLIISCMICLLHADYVPDFWPCILCRCDWLWTWWNIVPMLRKTSLTEFLDV